MVYKFWNIQNFYATIFADYPVVLSEWFRVRRCKIEEASVSKRRAKKQRDPIAPPKQIYELFEEQGEYLPSRYRGAHPDWKNRFHDDVENLDDSLTDTSRKELVEPPTSPVRRVVQHVTPPTLFVQLSHMPVVTNGHAASPPPTEPLVTATPDTSEETREVTIRSTHPLVIRALRDRLESLFKLRVRYGRQYHKPEKVYAYRCRCIFIGLTEQIEHAIKWLITQGYRAGPPGNYPKPAKPKKLHDQITLLVCVVASPGYDFKRSFGYMRSRFEVVINRPTREFYMTDQLTRMYVLTGQPADIELAIAYLRETGLQVTENTEDEEVSA